MKILVTGGAGYIGSFMIKTLLERGDEVTVLDNLKTGHKDSINDRAKFLLGDILDKNFLAKVLSDNKFEAVFHFAGLISMEESVKNPYIYFENNTFGALNLIKEMVKNGVNKFIFSSTAGVYGNPIKIPIPEDHSTNPTNPYGESKLMTEKILSWYGKTFGLNFASLRYFNAAGGSLDAKMGEDHLNETHIIPNAIKAALQNREFVLYGNDYNTDDGTCIRDYIHVIDLVDSHILALERLEKEDGGFFVNVGTGKGYSNRQVIDEIKKISGVDFKVRMTDRRSGDAEVLVADPTKIKKELGFNPKYSDLETIVKTAWNYHKFKVQSSK